MFATQFGPDRIEMAGEVALLRHLARVCRRGDLPQRREQGDIAPVGVVEGVALGLMCRSLLLRVLREEAEQRLKRLAQHRGGRRVRLHVFGMVMCACSKCLAPLEDDEGVQLSAEAKGMTALAWI